MKKAVCSGYYGFDNFGDDAVLKVLVEIFSKKYDLTVFSANPNKTAALYDVHSIYSFNYTEVIKEIKSTDVFISGGGSLLQDTTSFKSLLYYLLLINVALLFGKKVIIFAQGMGPFKNSLSRFLVRQTLKNCSIVTVRDEKSFELLNKWGVRCSQVCDPVFSIPITTRNKNGKLGIQLRSCQDLSENFLENLASAINQEFGEMPVVLYSLQDKLDLNICKNFAKKLKTTNIEIKQNLTIDEAITELSELEYLIAMRFHATLIALKAGVKTLPVAYDPKVEILAQEINIPFIKLNKKSNILEHVQWLKAFDTTGTQEYIKNKFFNVDIFDI